jgi:hypothetical protein
MQSGFLTKTAGILRGQGAATVIQTFREVWCRYSVGKASTDVPPGPLNSILKQAALKQERGMQGLNVAAVCARR